MMMMTENNLLKVICTY